MSLLVVLESLPIGDITETHEMMESTNTCSIKISLVIIANLFLTRNTYSIYIASWNIECVIRWVKELAWNIVLKTGDATIRKNQVKVLGVIEGETSQVHVLRLYVFWDGNLVNRVLSVVLKVPGDQIETLIVVINNNKLDKVFKECGINTINPDIRSQVKVDLVNFGRSKHSFASNNIGDLVATFHEEVLVAYPSSFNLVSSLACMSYLARIFYFCSLEMLKLSN